MEPNLYNFGPGPSLHDRVPDLAGLDQDNRASATDVATAPKRRRTLRGAFRKGQRAQPWDAATIQLLAAFGSLLLALGVSRVLGLTQQSLWYDEGYTATLAQAGSFAEFWRQFGAFTMSEHLQPLYYLGIFAWSRMFGVSDFALRLPSALFSAGAGVAACASVWLLTRRHTLTALAALAMLGSSYSLYYGQEARPYALLQMLSFGFVLLWVYARRWRSQAMPLHIRLLLGAMTGLCLLGSPFTALLVLSAAAADLVVSRRLRSWMRVWAPALLLACGIYLAYLVPALRTMPAFLAHDVTQIRQPLWMNVGYALFGVAYGTTLPPATTALRGAGKLQAVLAAWTTVVPAVVILSMLLWAGVRQVRRAALTLEPRMRALLWAAGLYCVCLFGVFGWLGRLNVLPRHTSAWFALLFLAMFSVAGVQTEKQGRFRFAAMFAGWLLLNAVSIYEYRNSTDFAKDDYRGVAARLQAMHGPQFLVAGMPLLLERYGAHPTDATAADPETLAASIERAAGPDAEVAIVFNDYRNFRWDGTSMSVADAMAPLYQCRQTHKSANFEVHTCRPTKPPTPEPGTAAFAQANVASVGVKKSHRTERPAGGPVGLRSLAVLRPGDLVNLR